MKQRSDGRWVKKVTLPNGKQKYFYSTARTEREAVKDINSQLLSFSEKEEDLHSFYSIAEKWNDEYRNRISDINYRKNTSAAYDRILEYFKPFGSIKNITMAQLNSFLGTLIAQGYYKKTVSNYKCILNMIFNYALLNGHIEYNPVSNIRLPANLPKSQRDIPSTECLKIVSEHHKGCDLLPFFLLYTGLRKSEALAIRRDDIDFKKKIITVRNHVIHDSNSPVFEAVLKTDAAYREVILLDRLAAALPKRFSGFLFSMNNDGKEPLSKKEYDSRWNSYCKKYDIKITAHQLRHGYATMLFEAGVDIKDTQELMGHSDINLTRQIYTHIRNERKKETANKLNAFQF